ncbi:hypothetical protein [Nocardia sp. NPDC004123]
MQFLLEQAVALDGQFGEQALAVAEMVGGSGVLEIASATGLLIPFFAPAAAISLAVLLVVMFPANIRAARTGEGIHTMPLPVRTLVQVVFIGACVVAVF